VVYLNRMASADTPADIFKRALAHAARALAEQSELEVVFGSDGPKLSNGVLTLPHPPRDPGASGKRHPARTGRPAGPAAGQSRRRPARPSAARGQRAAEVFEAVEQARVEAVGSTSLAGVRANMNAALLTRLEKMGALRAEAERVPVAEAVALLVRERLTGQRSARRRRRHAGPRPHQLEDKAGAKLDALAEVAGRPDRLRRGG
jgi:cobaltochelatase CobT